MPKVSFKNTKTDENIRVSLVKTNSSIYDLSGASSTVVDQPESLDFCLSPDTSTNPIDCVPTTVSATETTNVPYGTFGLSYTLIAGDEIVKENVVKSLFFGAAAAPSDAFSRYLTEIATDNPDQILLDTADPDVYNFKKNANGSWVGVSGSVGNVKEVTVRFKPTFGSTDVYAKLFGTTEEINLISCSEFRNGA